MNRTIAILGVVAVLSAIYVLLLQPMEEKRGNMQEQLRSNYGTLIRYEKYSERKDDANERLEAALIELERIERHVLPNSDTSVAFAKLQLDIQRMATQSGLTVVSIKPLPTVEFKHYTGLPIFLDCTGDIKNLGEFLRVLDSGDVLLDTNLRGIAAQQDGSLRIKIQLTGLMSS
jgi:Tfp pilus assembly protein PilO